MRSLSILVYHWHTQISLHPYVAHTVIELSVFQGMKSFPIDRCGKQNGTLKIIYLRDMELIQGERGELKIMEFLIRNSGILDLLQLYQ